MGPIRQFYGFAPQGSRGLHTFLIKSVQGIAFILRRSALNSIGQMRFCSVGILCLLFTTLFTVETVFFYDILNSVN